MGLTKSFCLWLACAASLAADPLVGDWMPPSLARQTGGTPRFGHRLPGGLYLGLGDYDPVTRTSLAWIFRLGADRHYRLRCTHMVEGDWDDSQFLSYFPLEDGGFALGRSGRQLLVLIFARALARPPAYFSFLAPDEASPWAVPQYELSSRRGRLEVDLVFDTPDGQQGGTPQYRWDGAGFR